MKKKANNSNKREAIEKTSQMFNYLKALTDEWKKGAISNDELRKEISAIQLKTGSRNNYKILRIALLYAFFKVTVDHWAAKQISDTEFRDEVNSFITWQEMFFAEFLEVEPEPEKRMSEAEILRARLTPNLKVNLHELQGEKRHLLN